MGVKGCKKATRYEDPKGITAGGLSGISTPGQLVDPLLLVKGRVAWTHTAFGKPFLADAGSSAFWSDSSPHWGSFLCTVAMVLHLPAGVQRLDRKLFNT